MVLVGFIVFVILVEGDVIILVIVFVIVLVVILLFIEEVGIIEFCIVMVGFDVIIEFFIGDDI